MPSTRELLCFMMMIRSYEPGVVDIIFKCVKSYTFKRKEELKHAVNLWCENSEECIKKYGHIKDWDVSQITDMWELFENKIHFPQKKNWDRIKWFSTTYKRIKWDAPSPTITMSSWAISSQNNVHPWRELENWLYSDARALTLKELFILTWLPENIELPEWASDNFIRQVIWEWVPPLLIKEILKEIKRW